MLAAVLQMWQTDPTPPAISVSAATIIPTSTATIELPTTDIPLPTATNTPFPTLTNTPEPPTPIPTNTPALTLPPTNTSVSVLSVHDCDQRKEVREEARLNETRSYVRCPVGEIQYSLQTDDSLESVVLQCPGKADQLIEFKLNEARSNGELLPTYDTIKFISYLNCQVSIRVNNGSGPMGYTIWREIVGSLP